MPPCGSETGMFGKRAISSPAPVDDRPRPATAVTPRVPAIAAKVVDHRAKEAAPVAAEPVRSEEYYITKSMIFGALIEAIDLSQLSRLDPGSARDEIRDIVQEIISIKNVVMSIAEQD